MEEGINGRIGQLIDNVGLNLNAFSKKLSFSRSALSYIVGPRQSKPSYDLLVKVAATFPSVSMEWLVRGQGTMMLAPSSAGECQDALNLMTLKYQDLQQEHERLQTSFARQVKLVAELGGASAEGA